MHLWAWFPHLGPYSDWCVGNSPSDFTGSMGSVDNFVKVRRCGTKIGLKFHYSHYIDLLGVVYLYLICEFCSDRALSIK